MTTVDVDVLSFDTIAGFCTVVPHHPAVGRWMDDSKIVVDGE